MIVLQARGVSVKRVAVVFTGNIGDLGGYFPYPTLTNTGASISSNSSDSVAVLEINGRLLNCDNQDLVKEMNAIAGNELTITESSIVTKQSIEPYEAFGKRILVSISITMPSKNQYTFTLAPPPKKSGWLSWS